MSTATRRGFLAAAATTAGLAVAPPRTASPTPTPEECPDRSVTFTGGTTHDSELVVVDAATLPDGGFVALHRGETATGPIVGVSEYLPPGEHENVTVELDEPLDEATTVTAKLNRDSDDDETSDVVALTPDPPYTCGPGDPPKNLVTATATVTLRTATPMPPHSPTPTSSSAAPSPTTTSAPGTGVLAGAAALGAAAWRALSRE